MNRLEGNDINLRTNDQEDMMEEIMQLLNDTVTPIPDVGMLCTFVYNAIICVHTHDTWKAWCLTGMISGDAT